MWIGARLRSDAHDAWLNKGKSDAARMTEGVLLRISKAEIDLRALAGRLDGAASLNQASFSRLVEEAETWDPDITFSSVAYARRIPRHRRTGYERDVGAQLTIVGKPGERAPDVSESFAVHLASRRQMELRLHSDLVTHPAMKMVVAGAHRMPGHVILGPSFVARNGDRHALIGTATDLAGGTDVMVAAINLAKFLAQFVNYMRHLVTAAARQARSLAPGARPTRWNQLR